MLHDLRYLAKQGRSQVFNGPSRGTADCCQKRKHVVPLWVRVVCGGPPNRRANNCNSADAAFPPPKTCADPTLDRNRSSDTTVRESFHLFWHGMWLAGVPFYDKVGKIASFIGLLSASFVRLGQRRSENYAGQQRLEQWRQTNTFPRFPLCKNCEMFRL